MARKLRAAGPRRCISPTRTAKPAGAKAKDGEVAEWLKAHAWKVCLRETVTRVRIPLSPPFSRLWHLRRQNQMVSGIGHYSFDQLLRPIWSNRRARQPTFRLSSYHSSSCHRSPRTASPPCLESKVNSWHLKSSNDQGCGLFNWVRDRIRSLDQRSKSLVFQHRLSKSPSPQRQRYNPLAGIMFMGRHDRRAVCYNLCN